MIVDSDADLERLWGFAACVREVRPGATHEPAGSRIVKRLVDQGAAVFVIREEGQRTFVCTDEAKQAKFEALMRGMRGSK